MDQMKYGSFIKKMAEDFATGQEDIHLTHIEDVQHITNMTQAYHIMWKKQQDDHDKGYMSSKNNDHSTTGKG